MVKEISGGKESSCKGRSVMRGEERREERRSLKRYGE